MSTAPIHAPSTTLFLHCSPRERRNVFGLDPCLFSICAGGSPYYWLCVERWGGHDTAQRQLHRGTVYMCLFIILDYQKENNKRKRKGKKMPTNKKPPIPFNLSLHVIIFFLSAQTSEILHCKTAEDPNCTLHHTGFMSGVRNDPRSSG